MTHITMRHRTIDLILITYLCIAASVTKTAGKQLLHFRLLNYYVINPIVLLAANVRPVIMFYYVLLSSSVGQFLTKFYQKLSSRISEATVIYRG